MGRMRAWLLMHARYLRAVARHKWFVLVAGYGRVPLWRLVIHDWSKFTPTEWGAYARAFYGAPKTKTGKPEGNIAFDYAWLHHQRLNPHHWQAWLRMDYDTNRCVDQDMMFEDSGNVYYLDEGTRQRVSEADRASVYALPMPQVYAEEMLADWRGANRAYGDTPLTEWYRKTKQARILHPATQRYIEYQLGWLAGQGFIR